MDKTFKFIALGWKVNTYENSATEEIFRIHGYTLNEKDPEVIVINTCSVTSTADQKSRQIIRRERRNFPNAIIVTMGCYSQHASEIIKGFNADIILGVKYRNKIFDLVEEFKKNHAQIVLISDDTRHLEYESFIDLEYSIISSCIMESLLMSLIEIELELKDEILSFSGNIAFHFEISGIINSELHPLKILFILILLINFHSEIGI